MKITRQNKTDYTQYELNKQSANKGCNICPNCGENKKFYIDKKGKGKGIGNGIYRTYQEGFFKIKSMRVDCYECYTCGCQWESEPYIWC